MLANPANFRYRRISMNGSTVINVSPDKLKPKEIMLEFPRKNEQEEQINLKVI